MSDETDDKRQEKRDEALESFAAATAVGLAVASKSMEMWFSVMAGFARASRDLMTPHMTPQAKKSEPDGTETSPVSDVIDLAKRRPRSKTKSPQAMTDAQPVKVAAAVVDEKAQAADDLKRISGIGPKLEQVLNKMGICTYEQVAGLQVDEIARLDDSLGLNGRIGDDKWLEQARMLAQAAEKQKDVVAG